MAKTDLFNPDLYTEENKKKFHDHFNNSEPIRHVVIDNFLDLVFAQKIYELFPPLSAMKTHYHGLNEHKSEDSDFEKLPAEFSTLHNALSASNFKEWLEEWTGISGFITIDDRLGYGLHQGGNNSFLDIHIDYNIHPIKKLYRKINLIIFFNPGWKDDWGGNLELWDNQVRKCVQSIPPVFNRCVIFECSDISYHGYNKISVPDQSTRKSFYQYYFIPLNVDITYRDTFFKARPQEAVVKKTLTPLKEHAKNFAKRVLIKLGMEKLLK